jgi:hypothetical protein
MDLKAESKKDRLGKRQHSDPTWEESQLITKNSTRQRPGNVLKDREFERLPDEAMDESQALRTSTKRTICRLRVPEKWLSHRKSRPIKTAAAARPCSSSSNNNDRVSRSLCIGAIRL